MSTCKKVLCLVCLFLLVGASVFAGGGKGKEAGKGLVFYLSPNQFDEFQTTASSLIRTYVEDAGYQLKEMVAQSGQAEDVALQLSQLDNAMTQNPAAIIIAACDSSAVADSIARARAQGIPVIVFDRSITETEVDFSSVAGCYRIGVLAGGEIAGLLKEKYGSVKGRILDIMGDPGDQYTVLIEEGFQDVMKDYPDVEITTKIADGWEASNAADIADNWLVANPDTDLIFSHAEHLAAAITSVLQTRGYRKGEIIMVSTAGMPMGLDLVREGWLQATVEQPLTAQAEGVAMFLDDVISRKEFKPGTYKVGGFDSTLEIKPYGPELVIPGSVITRENVDDKQFWGNQVE
ncbi:MAG: sugar ABC transporter substrate-binding protein [Spirochaetota bacterium]